MSRSVLGAVYRGWRVAYRDRNLRAKPLSPLAFMVNHWFSLEQRLLTAYRVGHELHAVATWPSRLVQRIVRSNMQRMGSSIAFSARIGTGIRFPHPFGIVIGEGVIIGNDVSIWQQVTLGSAGRRGSDRQYPTVGDRVRLYAKCTVIGEFVVHEGAVVAASAVVTASVPPGTVVAGIPARVLGKVDGDES